MDEASANAKIKRLGGYEKLYRIKLEADYLAKLAYDGAKRRYGEVLNEEVSERIKFELHIMKTMGFPGYFLIVQDFISAARNKLDVSVGPGRGSAAGSAVAYCLGITQIDPIKYDLLFERFLNPDRISLPDIDVDFDDDGRGRVLNWVTEKYGQEKVAHIITYGTMATKLAIKDVARVQKLPLSESDRLCKLVPDKIPDKKLNLPNAIAYVPELQAAEVSTDPILRDTIKYAKHNEEYKHAGTISLDFRNDSYHSILRLMWFWMSYMYNVSKEDYLGIDFWNMWNAILDYDASLFYLVTKRDGRELVYWEELVGVHPRRVPLSDYSWNDNYIISDTVTIDFDYNIRRDPLDPGILADINVLSIQNTNANNTAIIRISSNGGMVLNDIYSYGPVIKCSNKANGEKTYYLEYRPAGRSNSNYMATTYYY